MKIKRRTFHYARAALLGLVFLGVAALVVYAQQITGTPGSPDATTTIPGNQLPAPAPKFGGVIRDDALQSKPWWPPRVVPPKGAPNILLIMADEVPSWVLGCYGNQEIATPNIDRMASGGSRFVRSFACTPSATPNRITLLTGRRWPYAHQVLDEVVQLGLDLGG